MFHQPPPLVPLNMDKHKHNHKLVFLLFSRKFPGLNQQKIINTVQWAI